MFKKLLSNGLVKLDPEAGDKQLKNGTGKWKMAKWKAEKRDINFSKRE